MPRGLKLFGWKKFSLKEAIDYMPCSSATILQSIAGSLVAIFYGYAALGIVFAITFLSIGISRVDHEAQGAGLGFRLIIAPGVIALWPLLAYHWLAGLTEPPQQKDSHR